METFNEIKSLVETLEKDVTAFFEKGNKSAGTRVRTTLQSLKKLAQDLRVEVQAVKKDGNNA
jgi:hypothetical protein